MLQKARESRISIWSNRVIFSRQQIFSGLCADDAATTFASTVECTTTALLIAPKTRPLEKYEENDASVFCLLFLVLVYNLRCFCAESLLVNDLNPTSSDAPWQYLEIKQKLVCVCVRASFHESFGILWFALCRSPMYMVGRVGPHKIWSNAQNHELQLRQKTLRSVFKEYAIAHQRSHLTPVCLSAFLFAAYWNAATTENQGVAISTTYDIISPSDGHMRRHLHKRHKSNQKDVKGIV